MISLETKNNSDNVKNFGKQLSMHIAASNPLALDKDGINKTIVDQLESFDSPILSDSNGVGLKLANFVIKKNNGHLKFIISNGTTAQVTIPIFKVLDK